MFGAVNTLRRVCVAVSHELVGGQSWPPMQSCEVQIAARPSDESFRLMVWHPDAKIPITKWPHQSGAPVGAAPPTRSQLRLQRRTQTPVQNSHNGCHQPTLDPLLANVCQASPFRLAMC